MLTDTSRGDVMLVSYRGAYRPRDLQCAPGLTGTWGRKVPLGCRFRPSMRHWHSYGPGPRGQSPTTGSRPQRAYDRPVPRAWHAWSRPERYLAAFGVRTRAEIDVMRRRGAIRGRNAMTWFRNPGTATGTPRSRARRPASTTGSGSSSLA